MPHFAEASDFNIHDSTFTDIGGDNNFWDNSYYVSNSHNGNGNIGFNNGNVWGGGESTIPKGLHSGIQEGSYTENGGFYAPIPSTSNPRATPPNPTPFSKERVQAILAENCDEETLRKLSEKGIFEMGEKFNPQLQSRNPYAQFQPEQSTTPADPPSIPNSGASRYKFYNSFSRFMKLIVSMWRSK